MVKPYWSILKKKMNFFSKSFISNNEKRYYKLLEKR
jgi:hypothetical protein